MQLVLHKGIEGFRCLAVFVVIIAALFKDIRNFLIGPPLTGTNFPNPFQKFVKVIPAKGAAVLHHLIVENKALLNVLFQRFCCPLAEPGGFFGVDTVAYGDDGIEIVEIRLIGLGLSLYSSMGRGYFHFGNNHGFIQFFVQEDVLQVLADGRHFDAEKFCHTLLCQPEVFIVKYHIHDFLFRTVLV